MTKTSKIDKKMPKKHKRGPICIKCPEARFLDPTKEICYKTGGLYCEVLKIIVGKYDPCHIPEKKKGPSENRA